MTSINTQTASHVYFGNRGSGTVSPISIQGGTLSLVKKDESKSRLPLKQDVWLVEDPTDGQKYSLLKAGSEHEFASFNQMLATWGIGAKVNVSGMARKPPKDAPRSFFPFLTVETIEKA